MADLGSFGTPRARVEDVDSFDYFGATVRVNPEFGELDVADFFEAAAAVEDTDTAQSLALLKGVFRQSVHPEDFDTFWTTAKRERQGIEDLMRVLVAVVEAVADRPTVRPSDSSDGPSATRATSAVDSSSQVVRRLEAEGRPSIALVVQEVAASRASA